MSPRALLAFATLTASLSPTASEDPYLISLRRHRIPVRRKGKVISHKSSYSGAIHVGQPTPQEFRVVFDTGSGHIILPSVECQTDTCLKHRRFNMAASETAIAINLDGSPVPPGQMCDQVTIGFGTGKVTGQLSRDRVCLGPAPQPAAVGKAAIADVRGPCVEASLVLATEMSKKPFELFDFDGVLGLGLSSLAVSANFSIFGVLSDSSQLGSPRLGVFLSDGEEIEGAGEIAVGGHNAQRLLGPLSWAPAARPELGYWQVEIVSFKIDGQALELCQAPGSCYGVVDTGTSHLGIPEAANSQVREALSVPAGDAPDFDCRLSGAPVVEIELHGFSITVHPDTYMRHLPLAEGVNLDVVAGVSGGGQAPAAPAAQAAEGGAGSAQEEPKICRPKLVPTNMPSPLGPNLFILGEPVLHRYYTVYDFKGPEVGFGLAAQVSRTAKAAETAVKGAEQRQQPSQSTDTPLQDTILLTQVATSTSHA